MEHLIRQELPNVHLAAQYKRTQTHPHTHVRVVFALTTSCISSDCDITGEFASPPVEPVVIIAVVGIRSVMIRNIYLFDNRTA